MKYKYLLFDLDGTLTDPKEGITASVQHALKAFGIEEPDTDRLTPFIGPPLRESFMGFYGFSEAEAEEAVARYREWFAPKGIFQNRIYPGIKEMLQELGSGGKILAVASSKPQVFVEKILHHFDIYGYFTVIVGSELDGTRDSKEEVIREALQKLTESKGGEECSSAGECPEARNNVLATENIVMIGDRKFDIAGGKAHKLVTVGVAFGYAKEGELEEAGADYVADTVEELRRILIQ